MTVSYMALYVMTKSTFIHLLCALAVTQGKCRQKVAIMFAFLVGPAHILTVSLGVKIVSTGIKVRQKAFFEHS